MFFTIRFTALLILPVFITAPAAGLCPPPPNFLARVSTSNPALLYPNYKLNFPFFFSVMTIPKSVPLMDLIYCSKKSFLLNDLP